MLPAPQNQRKSTGQETKKQQIQQQRQQKQQQRQLRQNYHPQQNRQSMVKKTTKFFKKHKFSTRTRLIFS